MSNQYYGRNFNQAYGLGATGNRIMLTNLGILGDPGDPDTVQDQLIAEQIKTMQMSRIVGIVSGVASIGSLLFAVAAFVRSKKG